MKNSEALNDLIEINNDRVRGYEKASGETDDIDLKALFTTMVNQSTQYANELKQFVEREGKEPAEGTTFRGKIYRAWMDVRATFSGDSRKSVLAACEFGEDAAQRAYETALRDDDLSSDVRNLIQGQKSGLRKSHDLIKGLRDAQPA
jgi:uncharacterized protein (TIGR02284 family)